MPAVLADKVCAYDKCGKTFTPTRSWSLFCSAACRYNFWVDLTHEVAQVNARKVAKELSR